MWLFLEKNFREKVKLFTKKRIIISEKGIGDFRKRISEKRFPKNGKKLVPKIISEKVNRNFRKEIPSVMQQYQIRRILQKIPKMPTIISRVITIRSVGNYKTQFGLIQV
jgi:hypothetical protein